MKKQSIRINTNIHYHSLYNHAYGNLDPIYFKEYINNPDNNVSLLIKAINIISREQSNNQQENNNSNVTKNFSVDNVAYIESSNCAKVMNIQVANDSQESLSAITTLQTQSPIKASNSSNTTTIELSPSMQVVSESLSDNPTNQSNHLSLADKDDSHLDIDLLIQAEMDKLKELINLEAQSTTKRVSSISETRKSEINAILYGDPKPKKIIIPKIKPKSKQKQIHKTQPMNEKLKSDLIEINNSNLSVMAEIILNLRTKNLQTYSPDLSIFFGQPITLGYLQNELNNYIVNGMNKLFHEKALPSFLDTRMDTKTYNALLLDYYLQTIKKIITNN